MVTSVGTVYIVDIHAPSPCRAPPSASPRTGQIQHRRGPGSSASRGWHKHKVAMISNIEHARSIKQHYTHPSISRSHTPLRLCHCARTSWGRGYSGWGRAGSTAEAHLVIRGAALGRQVEVSMSRLRPARVPGVRSRSDILVDKRAIMVMAG